MHNQEWYKRTCRELRMYRIYKKRLEFLMFKMGKAACPASKLVATYGEHIRGFDSDISDDVELARIELICKGIELAFETLSDVEKTLLTQKFFYGLPDHVVSSEIQRAKATFYEMKDRAVRKVAMCLGYLKIDCV